MLKIIVGVIVLAGVGLYLVYQFSGVNSFDPTEQGRQAKAAIAIGMTWQEVVDGAGPPRTYQIIMRGSRNGQPVYRPGGRQDFSADKLAAEIADRQTPFGFVFPYMFSAQVAFEVAFDDQGVVVDIVDTPTMADLLQTREK